MTRITYIIFPIVILSVYFLYYAYRRYVIRRAIAERGQRQNITVATVTRAQTSNRANQAALAQMFTTLQQNPRPSDPNHGLPTYENANAIPAAGTDNNGFSNEGYFTFDEPNKSKEPAPPSYNEAMG